MVNYSKEVVGGHESEVYALKVSYYAIGTKFLASAEKHDRLMMSFDFNWESVANKNIIFNSKKIIWRI